MSFFGWATRKRRRIAALSYEGTNNLGDEIQSIAAMRFLPRIDAWVDRERLDEFESDEAHKIILNGWFLHRPDHWPPAKTLDPLVVSFHLTRETWAGYNEKMIPPASTVLSESGCAYLRKYAPIGARDVATMQQLQKHNIDAYFSGCLTLTLQPEQPAPRGLDVYSVDVDEDVAVFWEKKYNIAVTRLSHLDTVTSGPARLAKARDLLSKYSTARCVITKRLHCALPCLAMGTPVLFIGDAHDDYRFSGLREFLHCSSRENILSNRCSFSPTQPPPNSTSWHPLRDRLSLACRQFIGKR